MYKYNAIPKDGSFRLFVLEPGIGEQPLRGILHNSKLDRAPYFEAISYVWGSADRCVELVCDNEQIFITASLSDVLHRVRLPDRPRTLWADSICINQEDPDEKGSQVCLMASIYRRSNRTLIRIGAHDDGHGEHALGLLNYIDQNIFANLQLEWDSAPRIDEGHPLAHDLRWIAFGKLLETPWFQRGWVVQEAAHAQVGVVLWGDHEFSWTTIMKAFIWATMRASYILDKFAIRMHSLHYSCFTTTKPEAVQPFMPEEFYKHNGRLLDELDSGRSCSLTDPRDRIYAFQDLPGNDNRQGFRIIPSYRQTFFEVCKDFASNYLDVSNDLDLLLYVFHEGDSLTRDLPSWVPLWSPLKYEQYLQVFHRKENPILAKQEQRNLFCAGGNGLLLSGFRFAKVRMVSEILDEKRLTFERIANLWSQVFETLEIEIDARCDGFPMFLGALYFGVVSFRQKQHYQDLAAFALEVFKTATGDAKRAISYKRWETQANGGDAERFLSSIMSAVHNRRLVVTNRGCGTGPVLVQEEDECVIIRGGKLPFLVRSVDSIGNYKLVGCMYHSSKYECTKQFEGIGWFRNAGLECGKDWTELDIEEEKICLL